MGWVARSRRRSSLVAWLLGSGRRRVCETGHMHARVSHAARSASWAYQGGVPLRTVNGIFSQPQLLDLGFLEGALASGLPRSYITDETLQELVLRQCGRQRLVVCKVSVTVCSGILPLLPKLPPRCNDSVI